ncbi:hypothetical protein FQZ97_698060 [compost metagenome]
MAMKAPIRRSPGRSMPSPKAPPSTAKPMPCEPWTKRSRKPWRSASLMLRDCAHTGICGCSLRKRCSACSR